MNASEHVTVARRFRGPPDSGNGGYCAGLLAEQLGPGAVEVTLRSPPPLERALTIERGEGACALRDGAQLIAEAKAAELELALPEIALDQAERCAQRFAGFRTHVFPGCFVCGTARAEGDGLRIFTGPDEGNAYVAAPWTPAAAHAVNEVVPLPIAWAALDCPGYFASASGIAALLGRMTAQVFALPRVGERYVVVGWSLGREGRKLTAGTALLDARGELLGHARQTWIALER